MLLTPRQANALSSGLFMVGFGVLFATGWWWPGIMFVVGITAIARGLGSGCGGRYALLAGLWPILFGVWALSQFNVAAMFVALGIGSIAAVFLKPWQTSKPAVDDSLE